MSASSTLTAIACQAKMCWHVFQRTIVLNHRQREDNTKYRLSIAKLWLNWIAEEFAKLKLLILVIKQQVKIGPINAIVPIHHRLVAMHSLIFVKSTIFFAFCLPTLIILIFFNVRGHTVNRRRSTEERKSSCDNFFLPAWSTTNEYGSILFFLQCRPPWGKFCSECLCSFFFFHHVFVVVVAKTPITLSIGNTVVAQHKASEKPYACSSSSEY